MAPSTMSSTRIDDGDHSDGRDAHTRPAWVTHAADRASKRRAAKACLSCRSRKVRCDVVKSGTPCTNCRLDGVGCVLAESNRGRRPAATGATFITVHGPAPPSPQVELPDHVQTVTPPSSNRPDEYLVSLSFEEQLPGAHSELVESPHQAGDPLEQREEFARLDSTDPSPAAPETQINAASGVSNATRLPSYIRPLPRHITSSDLEYLANKGALTIPDDDLRIELLRIYYEIVHHFMPALDLDDFLNPIVLQSGNPVSLLLLQAVMFASVTFVDMSLLQERGYKSRKEARKIFFSRVRLLYGLECERDRLVLIQSLLLMTYWYDSPADEKDTWYWMGIALSLAQGAGYHLDPQRLAISTREKRLRRRVWWCCVMRDRLLALGIRRPSRIRRDDFDVIMLSIDDFGITAPSPALINALGELNSAALDTELRTTVAAMCIDLAKLCVCLGRILHSQYTVFGHNSSGLRSLSNVILGPRTSDEQIQELVKCDAELVALLEAQDARSKYMPQSLQNSQGSERIIHLHQALLHMIYLTTVGVLHRPQVSQGGSNNIEARKTSKDKAADAAVGITKLAFDLDSNAQLRYLSTSSIPAFLSAALFHLLKVQSRNEETRNLSLGRFYQCVYVLDQLQDMYASADYALRFLQTVLKNTGIKIPMMSLALSSKSKDTAKSRRAGSSASTSYQRDQGAGGDGSQREIMGQSASPLFTSLGPWPSAWNDLLWTGNNQVLNGMELVSPHLEAWMDVDVPFDT